MSTSARDTLVLFNTSNKHNKITRPPSASPRDTCFAPLAFRGRAIHSQSALSHPCFRSARPCHGGLCSRRASDCTLLHDAHVDGFLPHHPRPRSLRETPHTVGGTLYCFRRPASPCTMTHPKTHKYAQRQAGSSTNGRSASAHTVQQASN